MPSKATLDPLTGVQTRRAFQQQLARGLKRAQRGAAALALVLIDLDHFKSINDAFGHSRGDQVLATFAQRITALLRSGDQLFRYGGDEFLLLLPGTDGPGAAIVAQRVLDAIGTLPFPGAPPLNLTLSIGLASFPDDGPDPEALFERADQRLYEAKRQGRQRAVAGDVAPAAPELKPGARLLERERALKGLHDFLEAWPAARRGLLCVTGPAGAGTSRFLAEAGQAARLRGHALLSVAGSPALRGRLRGALAEARLEVDGSTGPVAEAMPAFVELEPSPAAWVGRLAQRLAGKGSAGLVIVADHLLELDAASLELLEALWAAPELPRLALIYGSAEARLPPLRAFEAPLQAQVELAALSPAAVRVLLRRLLHWEAPEAFGDWLYAQTGGLPARLQRGASYLIESGLLRAVGDNWELAPNLAAVPLRERLDQLLDPPSNLPVFPTLFVGRDAELQAVKDRLRAERLVVLVGQGGIGKSRLAVQAAAELRAGFPDGAFAVSLAPITGGDFIVPAIAQALRLPFHGSADPAAQLLAHLRDKRLLLVLETFEHLIDADRNGPALVARILEAAPHVRLLVTSRERLELPGESVVELRGLASSQATGATSEATGEATGLGAGASAVQLFLQSARRVAPDFALTEANRAAVQRICQLVDGLPLGIELAAAWAALLDCQEIAEQIERNLDFLGPAPSDLAGQPRSARATLDYFWGLLSPDEQRVTRQLSVFRGSFTREAARPVAGASLFFLAALVDRAFLAKTATGRYQPHELLRRYAASQLAAVPAEQGDAQARHADYYCTLAEQAEPELTGARQAHWLERLEQENDNLRAALEWSLRPPAAERPGLRLAVALWRFWWVRGYLSEGRRWLEQALGLVSSDPPARRARALQRVGILARSQGDWVAARERLEAGLELFQQIGDRLGCGDSFNSLGLLALNQEDYERARLNFEQSLALDRELGDRQRVGVSLNNLGGIALQQGQTAAARSLFTESLALRREVGDQWGIANALLNLSEVAFDQGNYAETLALCQESLSLRQQLGDMSGLALCLEGAARAWVAQGQAERAAVLLGGAERLREIVGVPLPPSARRVYLEGLAAARAALGEAAFATMHANGRGLSLTQLAEQARVKDEG